MRVAIIILVITFSGCSYALKPHIPAFERTYVLHASEPSTYSIRVESSTAQEYRVASNGEVHIVVPESPRACDRHFLGVNFGGSGWPRIFIVKHNRKTQELSPLELYDVPQSKEGVYDLHVE